MANEKKGITVKVDADLHAEISRYIQENGMTMTEFVIRALDDELHPKIQNREDTSMEKTRTIAFQVPEEMYQRIKDYLQRSGMTQKQFFMELIEDALEQEQNERVMQGDEGSDDPDYDDEYDQEETDVDDVSEVDPVPLEDETEPEEYPTEDELEAVFGEDETAPGEDEDMEEGEDEGFTVNM